MQTKKLDGKPAEGRGDRGGVGEGGGWVEEVEVEVEAEVKAEEKEAVNE